MTNGKNSTRRQAVRGVLWTEVEQRVLLIEIHFSDTGKRVWITPGGGRNEGEETAETLAREVAEETGYRGAVSAGLLWHRSHDFHFIDQIVCQDEEFHLVNVPYFEPALQDDSDQYEKDMFQAWHWWSVEEILTSPDMFSPRALGTLLQRFLQEGVPEQPPTVGV